MKKDLKNCMGKGVITLRKKIKRYRMAEDVCVLIGGMAFMTFCAVVGGYERGSLSTMMFLSELVIPIETMALSYMARKLIKYREYRYIQSQGEKRKQEMKKSA